MIQLKSFHPNFFLFGSVVIVNADSPILLLVWLLGILHVTLLGSGTDEPEFIRIIH